MDVNGCRHSGKLNFLINESMNETSWLPSGSAKNSQVQRVTRKIVTNLSPPLQAMPLTPTPAGSGCHYRYSISHNVCDVVILGPICATKSFDGPAIAYVVASTNTVHQMRSSSCTSVGCWGWVYEGFGGSVFATGRCEIGIHGPI